MQLHRTNLVLQIDVDVATFLAMQTLRNRQVIRTDGLKERRLSILQYINIDNTCDKKNLKPSL